VLGDVGRGALLGIAPISPMRTMTSVSGSDSNAASASMCVVPMTGSPPMPIAVEKPRSRSSYIIW